MKKLFGSIPVLCLVFLSVGIGFVGHAADLPGYYPVRREITEFQFASAEQLDDTKEIPLAAREEQRSLDGIWKIGEAGNSAHPFPADVDSEKGLESPDFSDVAWSDIRVPGDAYLKFKELRKLPYAKVWFRKQFELSANDLRNRRLLIRFETVGYDMTLFVNGKKAGTHQGEFSPFEFDISDAVHPGKNTLAIRVLRDMGPFLGGIDGADHAYGAQWGPDCIRFGLWQSVSLKLVPELYFQKLSLTPRLTEKTLECDYTIVNSTGKEWKGTLSGGVFAATLPDAGTQTGMLPASEEILKPGVNHGTLKIPVSGMKLWAPGSPYLYFCNLTLSENGKTVSSKTERFGFREFHATDGKFFLNGEPCFLFGQNLDSYKLFDTSHMPYYESMIRLFLETGSNIYRGAHHPLPKIFLDRADEMGIMVYHEWGWSFSVDHLNLNQFEKNNLRQVEEYVENAYNNPSVVMWSMGNELKYRNRPEIARQMDLQTNLVRKLDRSGRPVVAFSGCGSHFGDTLLETDVLDTHDYVGYGSAWTLVVDVNREVTEFQRKLYAKSDKIHQPLITWESVGYSWCDYSDTKFRKGNVEDYAAYVQKPFGWGEPNGIGYIGMAPLWKAVRPGFREYAVNLFGSRILEAFRNEPRYAGFALPWLGKTDAATLWTQKTFVSLFRDNGCLYPHNLFSGKPSDWKLNIINDSNRALTAPELELQFVDREGKIAASEKYKAPEVKEYTRNTRAFVLTVPELPDGAYQLRLNLYSDGEKVSQNFYNVNVFSPKVLTEQLPQKREIFVLDTKVPENIAALEKALNAFGLKYSIVSGPENAKDDSVLIVPPECKKAQTVDLDENPAFRNFMRDRGGILLVLEQKNPQSRFPYELRIYEHGNNFVDFVSPEHPLMSGLDDTCFDTWNNPDHGYVVTHTLTPYLVNAVAVKGVHLQPPINEKFGNAIIEGREGRGRYLHSQLLAFQNAGIDSGAACYLRNLMAYAAGSVPPWKEARAMKSKADMGYVASPEQTESISLAAAANTSFADDALGDGKGGWTDQGPGNDFSAIPKGKQRAAGIDFEIIDPAKNDGKSCIGIKGTRAPYYPAQVSGIQVGGKKYGRLFFLHTAAWVTGKRKIGVYRIHYTDGSHADCDVVTEQNLGDWYRVFPLADAKIGIEFTGGQGHSVCAFVTEWHNPHPEKPIASIDVLSDKETERKIEWVVNEKKLDPIWFLLAITGDQVSPNRFEALGKEFKGSSAKGGAFFQMNEVKQPDGTTLLKTTLPVTDAKQTASIQIQTDFSRFGTSFHYLVCRMKADRDTVVTVTLPEKDWKGNYSAEFELIGDGEFHTYRARMGKELTFMGGHVPPEKYRNEIWVFHRPKNVFFQECATPVTLEIASIVLE